MPQKHVVDVDLTENDMKLTIVGAFFCAVIGGLSAIDKVTIGVHDSDAAIRQQLLNLTPPGMPIEAVHEVLENHLVRDKETEIAGWPVRVTGGCMIVALGRYYELSTIRAYWLPFATVVDATWFFDERNKLRDIQVRRLVHGL